MYSKVRKVVERIYIITMYFWVCLFYGTIIWGLILLSFSETDVH